MGVSHSGEQLTTANASFAAVPWSRGNVAKQINLEAVALFENVCPQYLQIKPNLISAVKSLFGRHFIGIFLEGQIPEVVHFLRNALTDGDGCAGSVVHCRKNLPLHPWYFESANEIDSCAASNFDIACWGLSCIFNVQYRNNTVFGIPILCGPAIQVSPNLSLTYLAGDIDRRLSRLVSLAGQPESDNEKNCANTNEYCGIERIVPHVLRGFIHRPCGFVHTLLGEKIVYLPLGGFLLLVLAGLGGGNIIDNLDRQGLPYLHRQRNWERWRYVLLLFRIRLGFLILFLGLP